MTKLFVTSHSDATTISANGSTDGALTLHGVLNKNKQGWGLTSVPSALCIASHNNKSVLTLIIGKITKVCLFRGCVTNTSLARNRKPFAAEFNSPCILQLLLQVYSSLCSSCIHWPLTNICHLNPAT